MPPRPINDIFETQRALDLPSEDLRRHMFEAIRNAFTGRFKEVAPNVWRRTGLMRSVQIQLEEDGTRSLLRMGVRIHRGTYNLAVALTLTVVFGALFYGLVMLGMFDRGSLAENLLIAAPPFVVTLIIAMVGVKETRAKQRGYGFEVYDMERLVTALNAVKPPRRVARGYRFAPKEVAPADIQAEEELEAEADRRVK